MFLIAFAWSVAGGDWLIRAASLKRARRLKHKIGRIQAIGFLAHTFLLVGFMVLYNRSFS